MQIENKYKIEKSASMDESKGALRYIDIQNNECVATNGCIAAVVPCVVGEGDSPGPITPDSIVYARKHTLAEKTTVLFLKDDVRAVAEDGTVFPRSLDSKATQTELNLFPVELTLPHKSLLNNVIPSPSEDDVVLAINPVLLKDLAEALGSKDCLFLRMKVNGHNRVDKCIRVDTRDSENMAYGAIMPRNPE